MCINISLTLFFKTTTTKHFHCVGDIVGSGRGSGWFGPDTSLCVLWPLESRAAGAHLGTGRTRSLPLKDALVSGRRSKAGASRTRVQPNSSSLQSTSHFRLWPAQQDFILVGARVPWSGSPCPKPELQFDFSGCK